MRINSHLCVYRLHISDKKTQNGIKQNTMKKNGTTETGTTETGTKLM